MRCRGKKVADCFYPVVMRVARDKIEAAQGSAIMADPIRSQNLAYENAKNLSALKNERDMKELREKQKLDVERLQSHGEDTRAHVSRDYEVQLSTQKDAYEEKLAAVRAQNEKALAEARAQGEEEATRTKNRYAEQVNKYRETSEKQIEEMRMKTEATINAMERKIEKAAKKGANV